MRLQSITAALSAGRCEKRREDAVRFFKEALKESQSWKLSGGGERAAILGAQACVELAGEQDSAKARSAYWLQAIRELEEELNRLSTPGIVEEFSTTAVDCFQDNLCDLSFDERLKFLRIAIQKLDVRNSSDPTVEGKRFARKSSVLRHLAFADQSKKVRLSRLIEARKCASLAVEINADRFTMLELGLSEWALARYEDSDAGYALRVNAAETLLTNELLRNFETAQLALSRLYRLTFQPLKACNAFPSQTGISRNPRRIFRDAYILGEAATQLWFSQYPADMVRQHATESRTLLELAVTGGYENSRTIISLAYVSAILDGADAGKVAIQEIVMEPGIDWNKALSEAISSDHDSLVDKGFALGIDQSSVLTRLGTFAVTFLKDHKLGESLYRAAVRLEPRDAIALTNLARFLVDNGGEDERREAYRLIQRAQSFADRRFIWWRDVSAQLESASGPSANKHSRAYPQADELEFADLRLLRKRFRDLERASNMQSRGYELERLIHKLAELTVGMAVGSYRIPRGNRLADQIDGYFEHGADKYRFECRWRSLKATRDDITLFSRKLTAAGVSGFFISMAGFDEAAIAESKYLSSTKAILLMDGDEMGAVFNGRINFDEAIQVKRQYFNVRSEPYHRVVSEMRMD